MPSGFEVKYGANAGSLNRVGKQIDVGSCRVGVRCCKTLSSKLLSRVFRIGAALVETWAFHQVSKLLAPSPEDKSRMLGLISAFMASRTDL